MNRWIVYLTKDFPFLTILLTSLGIAWSGSLLSSHSVRFLPIFLAFLPIFTFYGSFRMISDLKSCEKDRLANPEKCLPSGIISQNEMGAVIHFIPVILFAYGMLLWVILGQVPAFMCLMIGVYVWLRERDFFLKKWLSRHPLYESLLINLSAWPVTALAVAVTAPHGAFSAYAFSFFLILFGAWFTYEICHQLNPRVHPIMATYIHFYGFRHTFEISAVTLAISAMGAAALNLEWILFPPELTVLITLIFLFLNAENYIIPQLASTLSLIVHAWGIALGQLMLP